MKIMVTDLVNELKSHDTTVSLASVLVVEVSSVVTLPLNISCNKVLSFLPDHSQNHYLTDVTEMIQFGPS